MRVCVCASVSVCVCTFTGDISLVDFPGQLIKDKYGHSQWEATSCMLMENTGLPLPWLNINLLLLLLLITNDKSDTSSRVLKGAVRVLERRGFNLALC